MWTNRQKGIIKTYQRYAGLADPEYRALLHEQTGATSSRDAHLTQYHFDAFMPRLEIRAHLAETNGLAVGRKPAKLSNWYYWRDRSPERGKASSRELWVGLCQRGHRRFEHLCYDNFPVAHTLFPPIS